MLRAPESNRPRTAATAARRGMTAVEMLATITVFGILSSAATTKFSQITEKARVSKAITAVGSDFQLAYQIAARNRVPVIIRPSPTDSTKFELADTTKNPVVVFARRNLAEFGITSPSKQVTMVNTATNSATTRVVFYPNGTSSAPIAITLKGKLDAAYQRKVTVSRTGLMTYE
jgi:prepilin-type N-terminal cleavage/methylation domain-containing protein